MKKNYVLAMAVVLFLGSCQDGDENVNTTVPNGELASVEFKLDASSLMQGQATRAYAPTYNRDGFSIFAYRLDGSNYLFEKAVNITNWNYDEDAKVLSGTDNLPIGEYRFIHGYGLNQPDVINFSNSDINATTVTYNGGPLNEVFLETTRTAETLPTYRLGLDTSGNTTVEGTLNRAVARVDLLFVSADKIGENLYNEKVYNGIGANILGGKVLQNVELQFTNVSSNMNMFGVNNPGTLATSNITTTNPQTLDPSITNPTNEGWDYITIGTGDATTVGTRDYREYDAIQTNDIIAGGAHIFGTYIPHNPNAERTTGATVVLTPTEGRARTITVPGGIPLERNKVTLIKIYVLNGNNVFTTNVQFEVQIISDWLDNAHNVAGEIN